MEGIENTKLCLLLDTFSKEEQKEFVRYLQSPYFNRSTDLPLLYDLIAKNKKLEIGELIGPLYYKKKKVTPNKKDMSRFRNSMSRLLKLAENFLKLREIELHDNKRYLADALMKRQLFKHCNNVLMEGINAQRKVEFLSPQFFADQFLLEEGLLKLSNVDKLRPLQSNISEVVVNLENYMLSMMLYYYVVVVARSILFGIDRECRIPDELLLMCKRKLNEGGFSVLAKLDYCVYNMLDDKEPDLHFQMAVDVLKENENRLTTTDKRDRLNALVNFCLWNFLGGRDEYRTRLKEIIEHFIVQGVWTNEMYLNIAIFHMVPSNYLELGEVENAKTFVEQYKEHLEPDKKEDLLFLTQAHIYFFEKKWEDAHKSLSQFFLKGADFYFTLYYRTLLIKLYYEQEEMEPLYSALQALALFLNEKRNAQIAEKPRLSYAFFRKCTFELARIKTNRKTRRPLTTIRADIVEHPYLHERNWLLKKVEILEKYNWTGL